MTGTECDLCGINDAVHRLPQQTFEDLAICDDCAVGRREEIVEEGVSSLDPRLQGENA